MASACNPSYSGGRDQEDCSSKPAWANSSGDPVSKTLRKNGLVEWLQVKAMSSSPSIAKKKKFPKEKPPVPSLPQGTRGKELMGFSEIVTLDAHQNLSYQSGVRRAQGFMEHFWPSAKGGATGTWEIYD
jgi:hypothetical protein